MFVSNIFVHIRKVCIYLRYIFILVPIGSLYILYMCLSQINLVREIDIRYVRIHYIPKCGRI